MTLSLLPFVLLVVPLAEIAVFIAVGGAIGLLPTLALIVVTAIVGSILLRIQGLGLIGQIQEEIRNDRLPGRELAHGAMILAAGVLLLTPGFVTDTLGLLLFIPAIRDLVAGFFLRRMEIHVVGGGFDDGTGHRPSGPRTIDLDASDYRAAPDPSTPWRNGRTN